MLIAAGDRPEYTNVVGAPPLSKREDLVAIARSEFLQGHRAPVRVCHNVLELRWIECRFPRQLQRSRVSVCCQVTKLAPHCSRWSGLAEAVLGYYLMRVFARPRDRKSTRLNSSHGYISYAVFCLKKKKMDVSSMPDDQIGIWAAVACG